MFIDDEDPERPYGQAKPAYVDWDNDGDLDLLVGNISNRVAYFENIGTRRKPKFAKATKLFHDAGEHFSFRSRPAPVDYNHDGLLDLVAGSAGPRDRNDSKTSPSPYMCATKMLRAGSACVRPFRCWIRRAANYAPLSRTITASKWPIGIRTATWICSPTSVANWCSIATQAAAF